MDNEDSGPRRFINFIFVLLITLVQLDVLEYTAFTYQTEAVSLAYCAADDGGRQNEPGESYYYNVRSGFPIPLSFILSILEMTPLRLLSIRTFELPLYVPQDNRPIHAICCIYLI